MADIRHSIAIDAAPKAIHPLVASGDGLSQWWAEDVTEDKSTKAVDLGFFKRNTVYRLQPVRIILLKKAEWKCQSGKEWQGTRLLFELTENTRGTLLHFAHADWAAETDYFVSCNTTWGALMFRLKATAEGKKRGPLFTSDGMSY